MLLYDPADLARREAQLREHAQSASAAQARLRRSALAVHWRSPAARAFTCRMDEVLGHLGSAAHRLDKCADVLCRHRARASAAAQHSTAALLPGAVLAPVATIIADLW